GGAAAPARQWAAQRPTAPAGTRARPDADGRSLLRRAFAARRRAERLAIGGRHQARVGAFAAVARQAAHHRHLVADLHRFAQPATLLQLVRRAHLAAPAHGGAVLLLDV